MGYTITNIAVAQVRNSILLTTPWYIPRIAYTDEYEIIMDVDVNLTGINTIRYMVLPDGAGGTSTLTFDIDGDTTDKTIGSDTYTQGEMDISGYTGDCNLIIKIKFNNAVDTRNASITLLGLKS